jgi:hypothetical protein
MRDNHLRMMVTCDLCGGPGNHEKINPYLRDTFRHVDPLVCAMFLAQR